MSTTTYSDYSTDNGNYDAVYLERETPHGIYRAVLQRDDYPDAPYDSFGCPIVSIERSSYGGARFEMVDYGEESAAADGLQDDLATILQRVYDGGPDGYGSDNAGCHDVDETLEIVGRWLKVFHGGSLTDEASSSYHQGGPNYVAYDTRAIRAARGCTGETLETSAPEMTEWQAYIDNDVWVVSVEKACGFDDEGNPDAWETIEGPVGGYYGEDHAAAAGLEMLEGEIGRTQSEMLPLEI